MVWLPHAKNIHNRFADKVDIGNTGHIMNASEKFSVLIGDCKESLKKLKDSTVNCCVTSPPYFGLRDYGVSGQIGLESRVPLYINALTTVFAEVWRVLRDDGVLFVNMGDTYAGYKDGKFPPHSNSPNQRDMPVCGAPHRNKKLLQLDGFRDKELMGIPWRFALAMRDHGWLLRQDIIWAKPNYTPEKVRDRFVKSHEHIFMFTKSSKYWFDGDSVKVSAASGDKKLRPDVWTVPVSKSNGGHHATFPPELIEPCVIGGCPAGGVVLDPFAGTGTTGVVALSNNRKAILCELKPEYADTINKKLHAVIAGAP